MIEFMSIRYISFSLFDEVILTSRLQLSHKKHLHISIKLPINATTNGELVMRFNSCCKNGDCPVFESMLESPSILMGVPLGLSASHIVVSPQREQLDFVRKRIGLEPGAGSLGSYKRLFVLGLEGLLFCSCVS